SSTLSTQKRQTFFRRKYCFFPVAIALSPPVGRCEAAIGRPPLCSGIVSLLRSSGAYSVVSAGTAGAVAGAPGTGAGDSWGSKGEAMAGAWGGATGFLDARF